MIQLKKQGKILNRKQGRVLKSSNPSVKIIKVSPKSNFYIAKLVLDGKLYEVHLDGAGNIIKEEVENSESNWSFWENDRGDE